MPPAVIAPASTPNPPPTRDELRRQALAMYLASDEAKLIDARRAAGRTRKSSSTLQVVAVGQTIVATALLAMPELAGPNPPAHAAAERMGVAVLFWFLVIWSHAAPLAPAVIGLVVYVALWAIRGVGLDAPDSAATLVLAVGTFVRVVMSMLLLRAVIVAMQHRKATALHDGL